MGKKSREKRERRNGFVSEKIGSADQPKAASENKHHLVLKIERLRAHGKNPIAQIKRARGMREAMPQEERDELWPAHVFIPAPVMALISNSRLHTLDEATIAANLPSHESYDAMSTIIALAAWNEGRRIYHFDNDLLNALADTPPNREMPVDVLRRLPAYGIFIEIDVDPTLSAVLPPKLGFMLHYDMTDHTIDRATGETQLMESLVITPMVDQRAKHQFVDLFAELLHPIRIPLFEGKTAIECIEIGLQANRGERNGAVNFMHLIVNAALYLCSDGPDVVERPAQKRSATSQPVGIVRDWDVGLRVGQAISASKKGSNRAGEPGSASDDAGNARNRPRPHLRSAHWHGYWYGPRKSDNRNYKVRWISPVLINATEEELPVVVHPVVA